MNIKAVFSGERVALPLQDDPSANVGPWGLSPAPLESASV